MGHRLPERSPAQKPPTGHRTDPGAAFVALGHRTVVALAVLAAFGGPALLGVTSLVGASLVLCACGDARKEARDQIRCSRSHPCRKPNVCLGAPSGGSEGTCVHPCQTHRDCPKPFHCSGRYIMAGKSGQFCRDPSVPEGGDCSPSRPGCRAGLACFRDRCHRLCRKDEDCPNPRQRCLLVLDSQTPGAPATPEYRACLDAEKRRGELCDPAGPFCARGHQCHNSRCLKVCGNDLDCDSGQICDGALYTGDQAKARAEARKEPDLLYCRQAGGEGAACNLRLDKSCQRRLFCLDARCRTLRHVPVGAECNELRGIFCEEGAQCFAGHCRKPCQSAKDCPARPGGKRRCEERLVHGKNQKLCL